MQRTARPFTLPGDGTIPIPESSTEWMKELQVLFITELTPAHLRCASPSLRVERENDSLLASG